ncbi:zinc ABC transporter substrate-binding protein [Kineosporia sp. J2-2]|uniref:Zinc ABC transporter substrate-binding protein n=1 Tax=Kineosporia corallincola TaxID=2835133 RepID=A0ABS5TSH9_9ACTN|nr:zinc ABC transporter substrate-binding protein [Kineosporia corallincola]MBT0773767.1 zinc ABC transporter substrate-binding protein [Kineosporia corallincola]
MVALKFGSALAIGTVTVLGLSACGGSGSGGSADSSGGTVNVVASTNVYGDIAATIGGDAVEVTSVISSASQDPHSYEADTRTQLAVSKADVVIENGGGYDDFIDQMLEASDSSPAVINAVDVSGLDSDSDAASDTGSDEHEHGEFNEHVWYDLESVQKVATQIAADLGEALPAKAAEFTANAEAFNTELDAVIKLEDDAKDKYDGEGVAITEPVPLYLLEHMGLENKTPEAFSEAVEEGNDISVSVLNDTLKIFSSGDVKAFVYNEQTTSTETEKLLAQAKTDQVPTVGVTETLPEGQDYVGWMKANVEAVTSALG